MITETSEAILNQFNNTSELRDTLTGGLWFVRAPQENTMPYGVFDFISVTPTEYMGGKDDNIKLVDLQISMFTDDDDGAYKINKMASRFDAGFNWEVLNIADHKCIKCANANMQTPIYVDEVWQITLLYEMQIIKE